MICAKNFRQDSGAPKCRHMGRRALHNLHKPLLRHWIENGSATQNTILR